MRKLLSQLSEYDLLIVLWYVRFCWLKNKVRQLTPMQILLPASILQIFSFIYFALQDNFLVNMAVGNMLIVGIALIPMTLKKPKSKIHWVKLGGNQ